MAKDKERTINPAQAQRKLEKQKALRKGKAEAQARRNEKLGRRNPERLQRQIDELKSLEESGQPLKPRDKKLLEELERDVAAIRKARASLGDKSPTFGRGQRREKRDRLQGTEGGMLGKRRRDGYPLWEENSDSSETDESVRNIPMPRDTPPPIPPQHRGRRGGNANTEPMGYGRGAGETTYALPPKPEIEAKAVYEAAPVVRNLRQEAVSKFVPAAVMRKQAAIKGQGRLIEPEEMDKLEREGYGGLQEHADRDPESTISGFANRSKSFTADAGPIVSPPDPNLAEEEARFERELKRVQIEEVEDEDY